MKQLILNNIDIAITATSSFVSAIIGTIVGWFLNELSKKGKLRININSWRLTGIVRTPDSYGGYNEHEDLDNADYYSYRLIIDVNNTSEKTKIMRNIKVIFYHNKSSILIDIPYNKDTERFSCHRHFYDEIGAVNIPAKGVITLNLIKSYITDNIEDIKKATKVVLVYESEKGRKQKVTISDNPFMKK